MVLVQAAPLRLLCVKTWSVAAGAVLGAYELLGRRFWMEEERNRPAFSLFPVLPTHEQSKPPLTHHPQAVCHHAFTTMMDCVP